MLSLKNPSPPRSFGRKLAYRSETVQQYGDWLSNYKWDLFVTLTFRSLPDLLRQKGVDTISRDYAVRQWLKGLETAGQSYAVEQWRKGVKTVSQESAIQQWRKLMKALKKRHGSAPYWVRVTESSNWRDVPHFHALLGGIDSIEPNQVEHLWHTRGGGIAKVERFDPQLGGVYYISASHEAMEFSKNLPPLEHCPDVESQL